MTTDPRTEAAARERAVEYARANMSDLTDEGVGALARGFHAGYLAAADAAAPRVSAGGLREAVAEAVQALDAELIVVAQFPGVTARLTAVRDRLASVLAERGL